MMYESIITQIAKMIDTEVEGQLMKTVGEIGFEVNKEELVKLLKNDRNQYEKGYQEGYQSAYERYKWHDLCKDPNDLPSEDGTYICLAIGMKPFYTSCFYDTTMGWELCYSDFYKVNAWRQIEPFEEEVEE